MRLMNKKFLYGAIGTILMLCLIIGTNVASGQIESAQSVEANNTENILTVTGVGKVNVKPDVAYIEMGVTTMDKDAQKAQESNKTTMNKVVAKLKSMGIEEKDIQTSTYNIYPEYSYQDNKQILEGYRVENIVRVTVRNIDKVGDILDAAAKEGINRSYGISFSVLDTDGVYKQALQKAIDNAKGKAEVMAKQAGVVLKKPIAIHEGSTPQTLYNYTRTGVIFDEKAAVAQAAGVPISSGQLEIQANVTIVYQIQ